MRGGSQWVKSYDTMKRVEPGRECPARGVLQLEQRVTSDGQGRDTGYYAAALVDRGLNPALDLVLDGQPMAPL